MHPITNLVPDSAVLDRLRATSNLKEVGAVAAEIILNYRGSDLEMVIGPVKHGGIVTPRGPNRYANLQVLEATIQCREHEGAIVFNQMFFRSFIDRHRQIWLDTHKYVASHYYDPLLSDFYGLIFSTGRISRASLIAHNKRSRVTRFARRKLLELGKEIVELPKGYHDRPLAYAS